MSKFFENFTSSVRLGKNVRKFCLVVCLAVASIVGVTWMYGLIQTRSAYTKAASHEQSIEMGILQGTVNEIEEGLDTDKSVVSYVSNGALTVVDVENSYLELSGDALKLKKIGNTTDDQKIVGTGEFKNAKPGWTGMYGIHIKNDGSTKMKLNEFLGSTFIELTEDEKLTSDGKPWSSVNPDVEYPYGKDPRPNTRYIVYAGTSEDVEAGRLNAIAAGMLNEKDQFISPEKVSTEDIILNYVGESSVDTSITDEVTDAYMVIQLIIEDDQKPHEDNFANDNKFQGSKFYANIAFGATTIDEDFEFFYEKVTDDAGNVISEKGVYDLPTSNTETETSDTAPEEP